MEIKHTQRRINFINLLFSFSLLVFFLVIILFLTTVTNQDKIKVSKGSSTELTSQMLESNFPGIRIMSEISNDPVAPYAIQYPASDFIDFNEQVLEFVKNEKESYIQSMTAKKEIQDISPGELNISFETIPYSETGYSFVMSITAHTDTLNGVTKRKVFRIDTKDGKRLEIQDVFDNDEIYLSVLSEQVQLELGLDSNRKEYIGNTTNPQWENFDNFSLTPNFITIYFNDNELSHVTEESPVIKISLNTLDAAYKERLTPQSDVATNDQQLPKSAPPVNTEKEPSPESTKLPAKQEEQAGNNSNERTAPQTVKKVALTFDDGPDPNVTPQILAILKKYDARATFFVLGSHVEFYPDLVREVKLAGHEIGNHTWTHANLVKSDAKKVTSELNRTSEIIEEVTGERPIYIRPPYGAMNGHVRSLISDSIIMWDVDTRDWEHRNPDRLLAIVKEKTQDGSIILMHDIHQSTADGLDHVLSYLQAEGYVFVPLSEIKQK